MLSNRICKCKKAISPVIQFLRIQQSFCLCRRFVFCPVFVTTGNQKFSKSQLFLARRKNIVTRVLVVAVLLTKRAAPKFDDLHSLIDLVCWSLAAPSQSLFIYSVCASERKSERSRAPVVCACERQPLFCGARNLFVVVYATAETIEQQCCYLKGGLTPAALLLDAVPPEPAV